MKTNIKIGLLPRIIIAILLGITLGLFMPRAVVRVFVTFNSIFSNLLQFLIPLIIIGLVTPAISDIGKGAGKLLLITVLIAYCDTVFAGLLSYGTSVAVFPSLIGGTTAESVAEFENLEPYFTIQIPAMVDVMSALVFSFTLGLGMAFFGSPHLKKFADEFKEIVVKTIEVVIIPLLPIYIFGIFLGMTHTGQAMKVITVFISIIGVIFILPISFWNKIILFIEVYLDIVLESENFTESLELLNFDSESFFPSRIFFKKENTTIFFCILL